MRHNVSFPKIISTAVCYSEEPKMNKPLILFKEINEYQTH